MRGREATGDQAGRELHGQWPGKRGRASLILLVISVAIVLLDIIGPMLLSSGNRVISGRLHEQLAFLALLSVAVIPVLLSIGAILGMLEWHAAHRASRRPSRMTVVAAIPNLTSLLIGAVLILAVLVFLVGPTTSLPRWPGW